MKKGIDISKWQGKISDSAWADITKKVDYVIIRVGYRGYGSGELKVDEQFQSNLDACKKFGIAYGLYFFSQAINAKEAEEEVELISSLVNIKSAQYGVWCDTELSNDGKGRADTITRGARTTAVKAFCDAVRAKGGSGGIYANYYWIRIILLRMSLPTMISGALVTSKSAFTKARISQCGSTALAMLLVLQDSALSTAITATRTMLLFRLKLRSREKQLNSSLRKLLTVNGRTVRNVKRNWQKQATIIMLYRTR